MLTGPGLPALDAAGDPGRRHPRIPGARVWDGGFGSTVSTSGAGTLWTKVRVPSEDLRDWGGGPCPLLPLRWGFPPEHVPVVAVSGLWQGSL